jgi:hypothetical protein
MWLASADGTLRDRGCVLDTTHVDSRGREGGATISKQEVPSTHFWTQVGQVQGVLAADCILGYNPLVATSAVASAYRNRDWGTLERWGRLTGAPPTSTVLNLLTSSMPEQWQMCLAHNGLPAGGAWYALTRKSILDPRVKARLCKGAALVYVFRQGELEEGGSGRNKDGRGLDPLGQLCGRV